MKYTDNMHMQVIFIHIVYASRKGYKIDLELWLYIIYPGFVLLINIIIGYLLKLKSIFSDIFLLYMQTAKLNFHLNNVK